uniref:Uncharacterized protein n=1 Tax=Triticum urartu TaxID=4572 RepID=A0A8R7QSI2_TRIUA
MNAISHPNPCSRVPTSHLRPPDNASKKGSDEHRRRRPQRGQGFHPKQSVMVGGRRGPRRSLKGGNRRQRRRQRRGLRRKPRVSPGRPPQRPTPRPKRSTGPDLTRSAQTGRDSGRRRIGAQGRGEPSTPQRMDTASSLPARPRTQYSTHRRRSPQSRRHPPSPRPPPRHPPTTHIPSELVTTPTSTTRSTTAATSEHHEERGG